MLNLVLSAATLGMLALSLPLLLMNPAKGQHLQPLMLAFACLALILSGPLFFELWPGLMFWYIALLPVAFFALTPCLWLYTQALSSAQPWGWQPKHLWHLGPQLIALPLAVLIATLPAQKQQEMFFSQTTELSGQVQIAAITFFIALLLWMGLSLYYLVQTLKRLHHYRRQLRQIFAEDSGKRLRWLDALLFALLLNWAYALPVLLVEPGPAWLNDSVVLLLAMALTWLLAAFGLSQQPGFSEATPAPASAMTGTCPENSDSSDSEKYQRSALSEAQMQRIAAKIQQAVQHEALYLDASLTLYKLAERIEVSAHYVSQTLNQRLERSFYDYINDARIDAAKQQLVQTDDSVLTIAMAVGFNARSSFYKAFKNSTGLTPVQYRAEQQPPQAQKD